MKQNKNKINKKIHSFALKNLKVFQYERKMFRILQYDAFIVNYKSNSMK